MTDQANDQPPSPSARRARAIEWVLAAISAAVVLSLAGYLLFEAVGKSGSAPQIDLRLDAIRQSGDSFVAELSVINHGHATAADVEIEGRVGQDTGSVTLDYAPAESQSPVSLVFSSPITPEAIDLRVLGYRDP